MTRLEGKVAIISGASSGIGRATMTAFADEGARVIGIARGSARLLETISEIRSRGGVAEAVVGDAGSEVDANAATELALDRYGHIDVVVNNAGVGFSYEAVLPYSMEAIGKTSLEDWNEVLRINLTSAFLVTRCALPAMRSKGAGSIINISSISGLRGEPTAHTYAAAKAALINLTHSVAVTYARDGIRCNCVAPGYVRTPMTEKLMSLFDDEVGRYSLCPIGRAAEATEIAQACLFFASEESSYCNGAVLSVDGGIAARGT